MSQKKLYQCNYRRSANNLKDLAGESNWKKFTAESSHSGTGLRIIVKEVERSAYFRRRVLFFNTVEVKEELPPRMFKVHP
jgi:hypothetical protein